MATKHEVKAPFYDGIEDFTFFHEAAKLGELFEPPLTEDLEEQWDTTVGLKPGPGKDALIGRLNISRCFGGEFVSCSFRATGSPPTGSGYEYHTDYDFEKSNYNPKSHPRPEDRDPDGGPNPRVERYLNLMEDLCDVIYKRIFPSVSGTHGLIVISGSTASGKSKIARGLIYKYLQSLLPKKGSNERRPHLVTFENPIDKRWADNPEAAKKTGIDYTPRQPTKDVKSLDMAVEAALRQTPKVLFVGEVRQPKDWKVLLRFGSTGHLGVTTFHAGSLTEAMGHLFRASKATTPARRSEVANQVLALVHLRTAKVREPGNQKGEGVNITLPAIWVRSPISTTTLMADGLAALLPYRALLGWDDRPGTGGELGSLGRYWFAEQLLARATPKIEPALEQAICGVALSWDLEGI